MTQDTHTDEFIQRAGGMTWTRTYFDLGITAAELSKRPGMRALLVDADRLRPAAIVFYKLDRAFRNAEEQAVALNRLKRRGIQVLKVRDPNVDGPQGSMIDHILGAVNQFQRELTGVLIRDHNQAMVQRGEWVGGKAPYGYRYRQPVKERRGRKMVTVEPGCLEPDPAEWPIALQIWEWNLEGISRAETIRRCIERGWTRRNGTPWTFRRLTEFYHRKIYAGYVSFGFHSRGKLTAEGQWYRGRHTPMITEEEWERSEALMAQRRTGSRERNNPRSELAGLITCGLCGGPMVCTGVRRRDNGFQYGCQHAAEHYVEHRMWGRESWIFHYGMQRVLDKLLVYLPSVPPPSDDDQQRRKAEARIGSLERQLRRLRDLYRFGEYNDDLDAYQRDKLGVEAQLSVARRELQSEGPSRDDLQRMYDDLRGWPAAYELNEGDVAARQQLWRKVIQKAELTWDRITVHLVDCGPGVPRDWVVRLPDKKVKRPGVASGHGGIAGYPKGRTSKSKALAARFEVEPISVGV